MKDSHSTIYKNSKHIYLEIKSNKKIVALLKYIIKQNQKIISFEIKQMVRTLTEKQNSPLK